MDPNAIITNIGSTLNACIGPRSTELNILTLAELSVAANLLSNFTGDSIVEWEEATVVPTRELVAAQSAFMGVELSRFQFNTIQKLFTHVNN